MPSSPAKRQLSQEEIDAVFQQRAAAPAQSGPAAMRYDFMRPDRIPAGQLRAIRLLHENFARSLASSLSAYLRSYVAVNLVSFEQISYAEFVEGLPSPTVVVGLNLRPYEGAGVLEIGPSLFFPVLEMLLGGNGTQPKLLNREITDIEQRLIEMLLRVIVHDLREAWKTVTKIDFTVQTIEKEPQFLQILAPGEAVVAIGMDIRAGESSGPLNIAIPSLVIKMMQQKFDQQWILRRSETTPGDQKRMLELVGPAQAELCVELRGQSMTLSDVMKLQTNDILLLDAPVGGMFECLVNGKARFLGRMARSGNKRAFVLEANVEGA